MKKVGILWTSDIPMKPFIRRQASDGLSDNEWYNEWQWIKMSDNEWQQAIQLMTTSDATSDNEWLWLVMSSYFD